VEPLRLRLLGRPEVSRGGQPLEFRSRKELALLFYLATEGSLHPREMLAALFCRRARRHTAERLFAMPSTA
jgi:DNA-binding SARP family transcriptional activator